MGALWGIWGHFGFILSSFGAIWGLSGDYLGVFWGDFGVCVHFGGSYGVISGHLGIIWDYFGVTWGHILGLIGLLLGAFGIIWEDLGPFWLRWAPCWPHLGTFWDPLLILASRCPLPAVAAAHHVCLSAPWDGADPASMLTPHQCRPHINADPTATLTHDRPDPQPPFGVNPPHFPPPPQRGFAFGMAANQGSPAGRPCFSTLNSTAG